MYGLLYVILAWAVYRGQPWSRIVVFVLAAIGVSLALVQAFDLGVTETIGRMVWPVVYTVLLNTGTARLWFAPAEQ